MGPAGKTSRSKGIVQQKKIARPGKSSPARCIPRRSGSKDPIPCGFCPPPAQILGVAPGEVFFRFSPAPVDTLVKYRPSPAASGAIDRPGYRSGGGAALSFSADVGETDAPYGLAAGRRASRPIAGPRQVLCHTPACSCSRLPTDRIDLPTCGRQAGGGQVAGQHRQADHSIPTRLPARQVHIGMLLLDLGEPPSGLSLRVEDSRTAEVRVQRALFAGRGRAPVRPERLPLSSPGQRPGYVGKKSIKS